MKFKTFRTLVITGVTAAVLGGGAMLLLRKPAPPAPVWSYGGARPVDGPVRLRPLDDEILARLSNPTTEDKRKDALPGAFKVNLYRDKGKRCFNRAKLDFDRDEKWDEKWSTDVDCDTAGLKREVAANDDERYDDKWIRVGQEWRPEGEAPSASATSTNAPEPAASASAALPPGAMPMRPIDRQIFALLEKASTEDKIKDALGAGAWKVNLYRDDKSRRCFDRVKIDYDRDEIPDEKWGVGVDCSTTLIARIVSTHDDGTYDQSWTPLGTDAWEPFRNPASQGTSTASATSNAPAPATSAPAALTEGATALRPLDQQILARVSQDISGDKVKDAIPGPAKVNLYKDAGQPKVNRLKIDLDRDEKWDERWDLETEGGEQKIKRHVAPADDEQYTAEYRLENGVWRKK